MALNIYIWNFAKKINSTATPSTTEGATLIENVNLKAPCTLRNPVFALQGIPNFDGNYLYVPDWERYYYVDSIEFTNSNIVTLSCSIDVLATYKTSILSTNAYVVRSSVKRDSSITDSFYVSKTGKNYLENNFQFIDPSLSGMYVVGIVGKRQGTSGSITGATQYVWMSQDMLAQLMNFLFNPDNFSDEIVDNVVKTFFNPFQYIVDCLYFPFQLTLSESVSLSLGWFEPKTDAGYNITCTPIVSPQYIKAQGGENINIPRPISTDVNDYRNYAPYTNYRLYIPYAGWIEIDSALLKQDTQLNIDTMVDVPSGTMMVKISGTQSDNIITTIECNCGAHVPIAQSTIMQNTIGTVTSAIGAGASGISKFTNFLADIANDNEAGRNFASKMRALGSGADSVSDAVGEMSGQISTKGSLGNISERFFEYNCRLVCEYYSVVTMDNNDFGSPYCVPETLSQHSGGYIVCKGPHFQNGSATREDIADVESYLEGGVYLE